MHMPRLMPRLLLTTLLGLLAVPSLTSAQEIDAAALYHDYCSVCHGDAGDGESRAKGGMNPPPRDFTQPGATADLTRARMIGSVTGGVPGTAMAAWGNQLDPQQIGAIVDFIRERFMMPSTTAFDNPGQRIYAEYCSVCHGDHGDGQSRATGSLNPPPRDFTDPLARTELSRARMLFSIRHGRPNTAMTGWDSQLDDAGLEAVADYIRIAFMGLEPGMEMVMEPGQHAPESGGHQHDAGEADLAAPLPDGLVGDIPSGRTFYNANCAICHGRDGDGVGPRAYFIFPKPRDFRHAAARASLNRPHLYEAIAHGKLGTEMPGWRTVLSPQEMANVAEYVFAAFITPDGVPLMEMKSGADAHGHDDDHAL